MTETPVSHETEEPEVSLEALQTAENFNWRSDYLRFCEVFGFTPDSYPDEKHQQFRELARYLNCFDKEAIAKMIQAFEFPFPNREWGVLIKKRSPK